MPRVIISDTAREPDAPHAKFKAAGCRTKESFLKLAKGRRYSTRWNQLRAQKRFGGRLGVRAAKTFVVRQLRVGEEVVYPLRRPITIRLSLAAAGIRAVSPELRRLFEQHAAREGAEFAVYGRTPAKALRALATKLREIVKEHREVPPHERTEADRRINEILDTLVDWEGFRSLHPVKQPLWGRVIGLNEDGSARVHWFVGPRGIEHSDATLGSGDVPDELKGIEPGRWFYSTARVFPKRIKWLDRPVEVPDPYDKHAMKAAWDLIPEEIMDDPGAWPVKRAESGDGGE